MWFAIYVVLVTELKKKKALQAVVYNEIIMRKQYLVKFSDQI